jgi:hypothetical protein
MNNDEQSAAGKDQPFAERRERVNAIHLGKVTAAALDDMLNRRFIRTTTTR